MTRSLSVLVLILGLLAGLLTGRWGVHEAVVTLGWSAVAAAVTLPAAVAGWLAVIRRQQRQEPRPAAWQGPAWPAGCCGTRPASPCGCQPAEEELPADDTGRPDPELDAKFESIVSRL